MEYEGKEAGALGPATLIGQSKPDTIKSVAGQSPCGRRQARQVAGAWGGKVVPVNPPAQDYSANLRRVVRRFAEASQP